MVEFAPALRDHLKPGRYNVIPDDKPAVSLSDVGPFSLLQVAAWPRTVAATGRVAAKAAGMSRATGPGTGRAGKSAALLRVEPLKWWLLAACENSIPELNLPSKNGCMLDLSHSRVWLRVEGEKSDILLNRFLPLDLRREAFPDGSVATTAFHHVGVTLWRENGGYNLLLPRSFAASLWELLEESGRQFGLEVK